MFMSDHAKESAFLRDRSSLEIVSDALLTFRIGTRQFTVKPAFKPYNPTTSDVRLSFYLDDMSCWFWLPSGLLALVLGDTGLSVEQITQLQNEDACLVVEHVVRDQLAELERHLGTTLSLTHIDLANTCKDTTSEAGQAYLSVPLYITCNDASFLCQAVVPETAALGLVLETFAFPGDHQIEAAPSEPQHLGGLDVGSVLIGPIDFSSEVIDTFQPQDLFLLLTDGAMSGGLATPAGLLPIEIADGQLSLLSAFSAQSSDALAHTSQKLWVAIGSSEAADTAMLPQQRLPFALHRSNRAWLIVDGSWERLAEGVLVDVDGNVALRILSTATGASL